MRAALVVMFLGLILAGCATDRAALREPEQKDLDLLAAEYNARIEDPTQHVVCAKEKKIGSHIPRVVCRTRWEQDFEKREADRYARKPRPSVTRDCGYGC